MPWRLSVGHIAWPMGKSQGGRMNVGIIGAGNVGQALAGSLTRGGHAVIISSTKPEDAKAVAAATGARAETSNPEVAQAADVVILAVSFGAIEGLAAEL